MSSIGNKGVVLCFYYYKVAKIEIFIYEMCLIILSNSRKGLLGYWKYRNEGTK